MKHVNVEIKARCTHPATVREILREHGAEFRGLDRQTDTYFNCSNGRLKLRQGNIETALIHYRRGDQAGPKEALVTLHRLQEAPAEELRIMLAEALGVKTLVAKGREIYFIDNVKFHIDAVDGLGNFVEIEAIGKDQHASQSDLLEQCRHYMRLLGIRKADLIDCSYSDMQSTREAEYPQPDNTAFPPRPC
ncbi:MAG: CYTH domain-containing protein [Planctomycetes bacterium]|nr:CYTH domain-containing protein [Planctomycetota bacterium]